MIRTKSLTLDDLERPIPMQKLNRLTEPTIKISTKIDPYYQQEHDIV